ncbi:MAG: PilT protein [Chloroflexi bacterium]|nr:PilT protein [Chloroflexota bacterium]
MIVLDTNVLSALMRAAPDNAVVAWLDGQRPESIWTTTITVFEIRFGIEILPDSRRRKQLQDLFEQVLREGLEQRILAFDAQAARDAATLAASRQKKGRAIDFRDTMIAGIVLAQRASIATRNTRHFADLEVPVIDPWVSA